MKLIWTAITIVLLINALLMAGGVAWLYYDGRLNRDRFHQVVETFSLTIEEQKQRELEEQQRAEQVRKDAADLARLQAAGEGDVTVQAKLSADEQANEMTLHRLQFIRAQVKGLEATLQTLRGIIGREEERLKAEQASFQRQLEQEQLARESEGFKNTVEMYEQIKPRQAKQMFLALIEEGQMEQVVEYLAAMQLRKAAAALREFKDPAEIPVVTKLLESLRQRGIDPLAESAQPLGAMR